MVPLYRSSESRLVPYRCHQSRRCNQDRYIDGDRGSNNQFQSRSTRRTPALAGRKHTVSAIVTGSGNQAVTWSVAPVPPATTVGTMRLRERGCVKRRLDSGSRTMYGPPALPNPRSSRSIFHNSLPKVEPAQEKVGLDLPLHDKTRAMTAPFSYWLWPRMPLTEWPRSSSILIASRS